MFCDARAFNQDLSDWDTSASTNMNMMFFQCIKFNGDISSWDVSSVGDMYRMFQSASFNRDISSWDVSRVSIFGETFYGAKSFSSDLSRWDTSAATNMDLMFNSAEAFSSAISKWDVSLVKSMKHTFNMAYLFNADLSLWDVTRVTSMADMFKNAGSYDKILCGKAWVASSAVASAMPAMFEGAGSGAGVSSKLFCCPRGFYLDATPSCQQCHPGRFQRDLDIVKNISDCPYTAEQACPAGMYVDSQSSSCRSCPAGKWSSERGVEQCADVCPVGTWSDQVGLSSAEQCTQCESGRYASSALLTAMTSSLAACDKACEAGKWSNETGLVSESQCKLCPKGRWSGEKGRQRNRHANCATRENPRGERAQRQCWNVQMRSVNLEPSWSKWVHPQLVS